MSKRYNLIQTRRGKAQIVMTDTLPKVNDRMRILRSSQRGGIRGERVVYRVESAEDGEEKFKQKPHNLNLSGGGRSVPARVSKRS